MNLGIAVDLAGGGLKHATGFLPGELKNVHGADHAGLHRPDRIPLIVLWRGRTGQIVYPVKRAIDTNWLTYVVLDELKMRMIEQRTDVAHGSGEQVIDANHAVAPLQQRIAEMRPDEASAARDQGVPGVVQLGVIAG